MKRALSIAALLLTTIAGTALAADNYDISINKPSAKAKQRAVAKVAVRAKGVFHMNTEYPAKLTINAPAGVQIEKAKQTGKEASKFDKGALEFDVAFTADAGGTKSFTGELKFAVCTDTECKPTSEKVTFDVDVK